jgi:hypothetical protein
MLNTLLKRPSAIRCIILIAGKIRKTRKAHVIHKALNKWYMEQIILTMKSQTLI